MGAQTVTDPNTGAKKGGPVVSEKVKFRTTGWGFNTVLGVEAKVSDRRMVYFELATLIAAKTESAPTSTLTGRSHLAGIVSKPIVLAGTTLRFGYKYKL